MIKVGVAILCFFGAFALMSAWNGATNTLFTVAGQDLSYRFSVAAAVAILILWKGGHK